MDLKLLSVAVLRVWAKREEKQLNFLAIANFEEIE